MKAKKKDNVDGKPKKARKTEDAEAETPLEAVVESPAEAKPSKKSRKKKAVDDNGSAEPEAAGAEEPAGDVPSESAPESEPAGENAADAGEAVAPPVNLEELARTIEALLFAAEEPIAAREIARAAGSDSATVRKVLPAIKAAYAAQRKPWDIAEVAGGYRLVTRPEFFPAIQRLKTQTAQRKLTQAALETLALIAYRQPIGRADVESVRGVGAGPVLRILLEKKLVKISGRGTGLGQPLLYGTTDYFLEHFGLNSIADLPKPQEFKGA